MPWKNALYGTLVLWFMMVGVALARDQVVVPVISGPINPVVADFISAEIEEANAAGEA